MINNARMKREQAASQEGGGGTGVRFPGKHLYS